MNATAGYLEYTSGKVFYEYQIISNYSESIISLVVFLICCIGAPLNGIVIRLLGFQIKRNPFTVLILNLAIADFGFLISMAIFCIDVLVHFIQPGIPWQILFFLFNFTYINGLFLLTAISIDRCVAVFFPIWHHCFRPEYFSSTVCVLVWVFSSLLIGIHYIMEHLFWNLHLVVTAVLSLPLITASTMILCIKICLQSKQMKHGRLLVMVSITLICFLILTLPLYIYVFITHFLKKNLFDGNELDYYLSPTASINSSINPVIYFLVGRKKRAQTRESIKVMFQRVFREDEI